MSKLDQIRALREANAMAKGAASQVRQRRAGDFVICVGDPLRSGAIEVKKRKVKSRAKAARAKAAKVKSETTYKYRDPEKRREYQRNLMRKRRKKK